MTIGNVISSHPEITRLRIDESALLRRLDSYHRSLRHTAMTYPAAIAGFGAVAQWLNRRKACVMAHSLTEIKTALAVGISAERITWHLSDDDTIRETVGHIRIGRFVASTPGHIAVLAARTGHQRRIVVDQSADLNTLTPLILAYRHFEIIGLHHRIVEECDPLGIQAVRNATADMAWLRKAHDIMPAHMVLQGFDPSGSWCEIPRVLERVAGALYEAAGEACEHHRCARPRISVSIAESSLLPNDLAKSNCTF